MARQQPFKNINWILPTGSNGGLDWDGVKVAVLMDIRDELQTLNRLLGCPNFTDVPHVLRTIARNTAKRKKVRKKGV